MTARTDHLVGRSEELGLLGQLLAEVDEGHPAAVEIVGEPGIGKTRLLAELGARADAGGRLVLSGSASELEQDLPFSVFVDALDEYLEGLDPSSLARLDDDVRGELAHVFPSLAPLETPGGVALQHERYRTHRAVRALLEHLARTRALVLMLDDLHWADSASIELLGALVRRRPAAGVLMVLALRPQHLPERLAPALERAHRSGALERCELDALTSGESRELLGTRVDDARAALLYEESGGNPFYLEQLARSREPVSEASGAGDVSASSIGVPSAVAASLTEELGVLSPTARLLLEGAAVAGDPFELDLAAAAAGADEASAMETVDELLRFELVRPTDVPRRFRFRHPLVRRAVYEATSAGWRLGAHERCATALEARGATPAARAHHVERSAREGDLAAAVVLREAGEEAARLAPASAARWFADALRVLPGTAPADERVDLLRARAGALTAVGRFADGHAALLEALEIAPADAHVLRAKLARDCAGVEGLLGRQDDAASRLAEALAELPDDRSPEAVSLLLELAVNAIWRARYEAMLEWAERALRAARLLGEPGLTAASLAALAFADSMTGNAGRAESDRSEAAALVDALSDRELGRHLEAAAWLGGVELYLGRYAEGDAHAARALALARATGQGELVLLLVETLGGLWRMRGKLAEASELLDGGVEASRVLGNTHALVWSLSGRSAAALQAGDLELALATSQEALDLSAAASGAFHEAEAAFALAAALAEAGQPQRAAELLPELAGGEELTLIAGGPRAHCLELLTRCLLALDRADDARRAADRAQAWAVASGLPMAAAWADRAAAAVDLEAGDVAASATLALASAERADEVGAPVEAALSRIVAGRALAGERDRAVAELQRAAAQLEACGALRWRDEAEHELRRHGQRIHRRTRPGRADGAPVDTLTARELQVARLVVDRRTNSEIAAELFLSRKTVETHLRNIFRKVGVTSRAELARAVERSDREASA
jgi:DNA-binding CsgD family transcriptional regulator